MKKNIRCSIAPIVALGGFALLTGCSDKEKMAAQERIIAEQKIEMEQMKAEAAKVKAEAEAAKSDAAKIKTELEVSKAEATQRAAEFAAASERSRNLEKELTQVKANIAEKQEKELATKNKYSHETLGENPTKGQLVTLFEAYETIEKDSPKTLEEIFTQALKEDDIEYRNDCEFQKGKFTPYTGWVFSEAKKSHGATGYPEKWLRWVGNGKRNGITIGFDSQSEKLSLGIVWNREKIREKNWYLGGKVRLDAYYKDGNLYSASSWKTDPNDRSRTIACSETNLNDGNGSYVFYDIWTRIQERGKITNGQMNFVEHYHKGEIFDRTDFENGLKHIDTDYFHKMKKSETIYNTSLRTVKGKSSASFKEDEKSKILRTYWNYSGKLESREVYKEGKLVKTEKF